MLVAAQILSAQRLGPDALPTQQLANVCGEAGAVVDRHVQDFAVEGPKKQPPLGPGCSGLPSAKSCPTLGAVKAWLSNGDMVGRVVRRLRELDQPAKDIARKAGVGESWLYMFKRGEISNPGVRQFDRVRRYLDRHGA